MAISLKIAINNLSDKIKKKNCHDYKRSISYLQTEGTFEFDSWLKDTFVNSFKFCEGDLKKFTLFPTAGVYK